MEVVRSEFPALDPSWTVRSAAVPSYEMMSRKIDEQLDKFQQRAKKRLPEGTDVPKLDWDSPKLQRAWSAALHQR